jgi:hypothetical protein
VALEPADIDLMLDLMRELIAQTLAKAEDTTRRPVGITGTVVSLAGSDAYVQPDDDPTVTLQATLYASGVSVGDSVLLLHLPPSGTFVVGPQAT